MPPAGFPPSSSSTSSPDSYATATESPFNQADATTTDISSPVLDVEESPNKPYDKVSQVPLELKRHCQVYLEENLYHITLNLLNSLLLSDRDGQDAVHYCPPPSQLSLLNTAIVHPKFTTRPKEEDWSEVSAESLVYLRRLLSRFGPINGRFKEAFRFVSISRHSSPEFFSDDDLDYPRDDDGDGTYAQMRRSYHQDGLWRRGQDFFRVVGWAFNCSVLYPNRWRHWKNWLKFMLDLIEQDLVERYKSDTESGQRDCPMLRDSILASYIGQRSGRSAGGLKYISDAIFADGSVSASSRFQEIWVKEHKENPKSATKKRKREAVDIEKGNFGGWMDDESAYSSQASEPPTPQKRRTNSGDLGDPDFQALHSAYVESIPLRQRLFSLLSYLCHHLPKPPLDLSDLTEMFEETVKSLPLSIFTAFVNTRMSALESEMHVSTLYGIMSLLMPSNIRKVEEEHKSDLCDMSDYLDDDIPYLFFLPCAANTIAVEDNAKVSVLVENILQVICARGGRLSEGMRKCLELGNHARFEKIKKKKTSARGKKKAEDPDMEARFVLAMSSERLYKLIHLMQASGDFEVESMDRDEDDDSEDEGGEDEGDLEATFMTAIDEMDKDEDIEDQNLYCICRRKQFGDMIACDNDACPYEWFHWDCVSLKSKPRGKWLCPECASPSRSRTRK
ncbi:hypothetical protein GGR54DRAFT_468680 [Hypoxylon sp. NC1633]|nr:hypothetical protein GGR54DRAFT_468680 [Hypoxylon sp. NC1633]